MALRVGTPPLELDHPPHPEPLLAAATAVVELVTSGGPPAPAAAAVSVLALSNDELAAPVTMLSADQNQRLRGSSFRERLAATAELEPWHAASDVEYSSVLRACANLAHGWAKENNAQVASTGLRFIHVQLRVFLDYRCSSQAAGQPQATGHRYEWRPAAQPAAEAARALASICSAVASRLTDRKASSAAQDVLHAAAALHTLRFVLATVVEPLVANAIVSPAPAAAVMLWLATALKRWAPTPAGSNGASEFSDDRVPAAAIACCAAALKSPAAATRSAALSAMVALDRHCPVLEAIASPQHGCSHSAVATVRAELSKHAPSRVVFCRAPRDSNGEHAHRPTPPREAWSSGRSESTAPGGTSWLANVDEPSLEFASDFECGNLQQAAMVDRRECVQQRTVEQKHAPRQGAA
jgi:hypothetical protein